jgi:anaerobic selenocysteine-containing dehydrogenase
VQLTPKAVADDVARLDQWVESRREGGLELIGRRDLRSNNSWMHNLPMLAKGPDRAKLFMNPSDANARGIAEGDHVRIQSRAGVVVAPAHVTDEVMVGVVSLPHGFGHVEAKDTLKVAGAMAGTSANVLTDELLVEPVIGTSILNGVPVEVTRAR